MKGFPFVAVFLTLISAASSQDWLWQFVVDEELKDGQDIARLLHEGEGEGEGETDENEVTAPAPEPEPEPESPALAPAPMGAAPAPAPAPAAMGPAPAPAFLMPAPAPAPMGAAPAPALDMAPAPSPPKATKEVTVVTFGVKLSVGSKSVAEVKNDQSFITSLKKYASDKTGEDMDKIQVIIEAATRSTRRLSDDTSIKVTFNVEVEPAKAETALATVNDIDAASVATSMKKIFEDAGQTEYAQSVTVLEVEAAKIEQITVEVDSPPSPASAPSDATAPAPSPAAMPAAMPAAPTGSNSTSVAPSPADASGSEQQPKKAPGDISRAINTPAVALLVTCVAAVATFWHA